MREYYFDDEDNLRFSLPVINKSEKTVDKDTMQLPGFAVNENREQLEAYWQNKLVRAIAAKNKQSQECYESQTMDLGSSESAFIW